MFGLGMSELIVLGVLALILIGPKQLPEVARTLGRFINDLKRSAEGITEDIKRQAKVDLELDLNQEVYEKKKVTRDPDAPLKIMKDPRVKETNEKPDIVVQAPDQMTFTFDPNKSVEIAQKESDSDVEKKINEKKN